MTPNDPRKILVAMSGGVDSSVTASLLREQGHEVIGLFMRVGATAPDSCDTNEPDDKPRLESARQHQGCCSAADAADARFVAGMLDVPFYAVDFKGEFERIIDYFLDEYIAGRTPNPCIKCNTWLKFGKLIEYADTLGADMVATGHYARIEHNDNAITLRRGVDPRKDQSYFLYGIEPDALKRILFPVGHLTKDQVRNEAARFKLPVKEKSDSVEICFVPDDNYGRLLDERRPHSCQEGDILDTEGNVIGKHKGVGKYTIGQRRGLGVAAGHPVYVTQLDAKLNTVVLGDRQHLMHTRLVADDLNLFTELPKEPIRCAAQIRYQHNAADCKAWVDEDGKLHVEFDQPQSAITPGQAVVLYDNDAVLGGGWIESSG